MCIAGADERRELVADYAGLAAMIGEAFAIQKQLLSGSDASIEAMSGSPANASAATRDAKPLNAGPERPQGLSRPFSSRRMWSVSSGF
jgi:hypothetical protein